MSACSAWCDPAAGVHVIVDYSDIPADQLQRFVGSYFVIAHGGTCIPTGSRGVIMSVEAACEAPPSPHPSKPHVVLSRMQLSAIDSGRLA